MSANSLEKPLSDQTNEMLQQMLPPKRSASDCEGTSSIGTHFNVNDFFNHPGLESIG